MRSSSERFGPTGTVRESAIWPGADTGLIGTTLFRCAHTTCASGVRVETSYSRWPSTTRPSIRRAWRAEMPRTSATSAVRSAFAGIRVAPLVQLSAGLRESLFPRGQVRCGQSRRAYVLSHRQRTGRIQRRPDQAVGVNLRSEPRLRAGRVETYGSSTLKQRHRADGW